MAKNVYIFDVDDTLIDTKACIRAIDEHGNVVMRAGTKEFNAPDSTERLLTPGLHWDFSEFESLEQIMSETKLPAFWTLGGQHGNPNSVCYIITARQKQMMLFSWLMQNNIFVPIERIMCYERGTGTVADFKARMMYKILADNPNCNIHIYEDDVHNIAAMKAVCPATTRISINGRPVQ